MLASRVVEFGGNSPMKLFLQRKQLRLQPTSSQPAGGILTIQVDQRILMKHGAFSMAKPPGQSASGQLAHKM
jgi:hypothetical protein